PTSVPEGVVIEFSTLVTIPDFSMFYPGIPSESFQPIYYALDDGSLIASPLVDDLRVNNMVLIITGCLLTVFLRNIWKAATYIRRGKVKKKGLLYAVLVSQLFGPVALIATITAQFSRSVNCSVITRIIVLATGVSISFLVTGVLGVKAYKSLGNNRVVLAALIVLRTSGCIVLFMDLVSLESSHSLAGRCYRSSDRLSSAFLILLVAESSFICQCFLYAVWKSHGSSAAHGRISIQRSLDEVDHNLSFEHGKEGKDSAHGRRGWWEYVPTLDAANPVSVSQNRQPSLASQERSIVEGSIAAIQSPKAPSSEFMHVSPIPRPSTVTTVEILHVPHREPIPFKRPTSPSSSMSRLTRYMPNTALFREVMRDESFYTAAITAFTVVSAAMTLIGVRTKTAIDSDIWIAFDWGLISLLVIHSFGRVIRRHENESLVHQLSAWYHNVDTDRGTVQFLRDGGPR
ncbi:hypothetical protein BU15DRAFT_17163, partial [Melanogaster broomeanus]